MVCRVPDNDYISPISTAPNKNCVLNTVSLNVISARVYMKVCTMLIPKRNFWALWKAPELPERHRYMEETKTSTPCLPLLHIRISINMVLPVSRYSCCLIGLSLHVRWSPVHQVECLLTPWSNVFVLVLFHG